MTAVGSVVLSLPQAFAEMGWLAGSIILFVVAVLMDISLVILAVGIF
jgi:amino acid permease